MTSAIETALTELSANLRRMEQRHQAVGYKFDRLYGLIAAAREESARLTANAARYSVLESLADEEHVMVWGNYYSSQTLDVDLDRHGEATSATAARGE